MKKVIVLFSMILVVLASGFSPAPQNLTNEGVTPPVSSDGVEIPKSPEIDNAALDPALGVGDTPLTSPEMSPTMDLPGNIQLVNGIEVLIPENSPGPSMGAVGSMTINIGVTSTPESFPKVAYCGMKQYLAVYVKDGDIYGQRITNNGALIGAAFLVNENETYQNLDSEPDVACEWSHNRYIVSWTHNYNGSGDYDIHVQGVLGTHQETGSQLVGILHNVADTVNNETGSSIACNRTSEYTCLVAYEYYQDATTDVYDIRGRLVVLGATDETFPDTTFDIGAFGAIETEPDVAWGVDDQNFVVAWEYEYQTSPIKRCIVYAVVYDYDQAGTQIKKGGTYLHGSATGNFREPAIAYNPEDNVFLVSMTILGYTTDVIARFLSGNGDSSLNPNFYVGSGFSSSIAWFGGAEAFPGAFGGERFGVAYIAYATGVGFDIMGVTLGGNWDNIFDHNTRPVSFDHTSDLISWWLETPDICGNSDTGRALVAWQYNEGGIAPDKDVYGLLVAPYTMYVPLMKRK